MTGVASPVTTINAVVPVAYDIDMAKEICDELPLESVEGIWLYPEDRVSVMILNENKGDSGSLPTYSISVVETTDAKLHPGERIGTLQATAQPNLYKIELATEKKNNLLLKPKACTATLSKDGDSFIIKRQKSLLKGRLNLNLSRLLPGFWKMVSLGVSSSGSSIQENLPIGMVKIYPSYDGNNSTRRKVRYL